jgi:hypothetical protein
LCTIDVINASVLPVHQVAPFVLVSGPRSKLQLVPPIEVVMPGGGQTGIRLPGDHTSVVLVLGFLDDAGACWRKYDSNKKGQVTRIKPGKPYTWKLSTNRQLRKLRRSF